MSIFQPCEGGVYRFQSPCDGGGSGTKTVSVEGLGTVPITGFTLELHTNHQFLHALDEFIYVFPFGDRIGELSITGMSFLGGGSCSGPSGAGPCSVYDHYMTNRLSKPIGYKPTKITLTGCATPPLLGFLTGLRMETLRPELPIVQWVLRYNVIIGS